MDRVITFERYKEEYKEVVSKIAVDAWTGINKTARELLGDELYEAFNTGWQDRKIKAVTGGR